MQRQQQPPMYSPVSKKGQEVIRASALAKWEDLHSVIQTIVNVKDDLLGLQSSIDRFTAKIPAPWSFYTDLLPKIKEWALEDIPVALPLMLPYNKDTAVHSISPRAVRHVLANVFFLNIVLLSPDDRMAHRLGELSYYGLYIRPYTTSVERIACQIAYFYKSTADAEVDARPPIRFERYWSENAIEKRTAFWESSVLTLPPVERVNIHALAMEDVPGKAFVDFANKFIHIGCIIDSLTQEEVLFSCCPEAFLCLLFVGELRQREVVIIRNARRYSTYTGYLDTFRWTGFWPNVRLHDLLVIDACVGGQFQGDTVIRDLEKAFLSFAPIGKDDRISTGPWGCGAFGGDKTLKFLQQLCAAAATNTTLDYSTYKDEPLRNAFHELHLALLEKKVTVGRIVRTIPRFLHRAALVSEFAGWIKAELLKAKEEDDANKAKEVEPDFDPGQEPIFEDGTV